MKIQFDQEELELVLSLVKRKIRGWEWAIDENKVDKKTFEEKVKKAKIILQKLNKAVS